MYARPFFVHGHRTRILDVLSIDMVFGIELGAQVCAAGAACFSAAARVEQQIDGAAGHGSIRCV